MRVGPGDDAAVVALDGRRLVATTDVLVDGVHFRLRACGAAAAARKALAVNVSDLAAMGAAPRGALVGCVLPRRTSWRTFDALSRGFAAAGEALGCPVVGGDTNGGDGPLVLAVTAFGEPGPGGPVLRRGARAGDVLSVTGRLGGSLSSGRHLTFAPRVEAGLLLARRRVAHAMMDLSDGLSADLPRLCAASGVGAEVVAERVPVHPDARRAARDGRSPLDHALDDGEDFELLVAHAPLSPRARAALAGAGVTLHEIGRVTATPGRVALVRDGRARPLRRGGFDHLRARPRARRGGRG